MKPRVTGIGAGVTPGSVGGVKRQRLKPRALRGYGGFALASEHFLPCQGDVIAPKQRRESMKI